MSELPYLLALSMGAEVSTFVLPDRTWKVAERIMPEAGKLVKYRTALYQMLGYVDLTGHWMASDGKEETLPVRAWREIADPVGWPERVS